MLLEILTSLQGIIIICLSLVITSLGCLVLVEGKDKKLGHDLINFGLAIVPCFFLIVFIFGFRY